MPRVQTDVIRDAAGRRHPVRRSSSPPRPAPSPPTTATAAAGGAAASSRSRPPPAPTACTPEKYNGGVPKLDLKTITVGFAQSEKEANPFRITETRVDQGRGRQARHQAHHHQRPVGSQQGDRRHPGHDRPGRQGADHLAAELRGPRPGAEGGAGRQGAGHDHRPAADHEDGLHRLPRLDRLRLRRAGQAGGRRDDQGDRRHRATWRSCSARPASTSPSTAPRASRTSSPPRAPS